MKFAVIISLLRDFLCMRTVARNMTPCIVLTFWGGHANIMENDKRELL